MKFVVFIVAAVAPLGCAVRLSSASFARSWLRAHVAPQQDDMAELKQENPEAYAIVNALLTKRSLGLLNSKHPSASFAPGALATGAPAQPGASAFALSDVDRAAVSKAEDSDASAPGSTDDEAPAPVAAPKHHDFWNWKPSNSAANDDAMVKSVLGEVANLAASKQGSETQVQSSNTILNSRHGTGSALSADESFVGGKLAVDVAVAAADKTTPYKVSDVPVTPPKQRPPQQSQVDAQPADAAPAAEPNRYLSNIDFGLKTPVRPRAAAVEENSYLKGLDLTGDSDVKPAAPVKVASALSTDSYLSSFSWDDTSPSKQHPGKAKVAVKAQEPAASTQQETPPSPPVQQPKKRNALLAWLGGASKTDAPATNAVPVESKPEAPTSSYAGMW